MHFPLYVYPAQHLQNKNHPLPYEYLSSYCLSVWFCLSSFPNASAAAPLRLLPFRSSLLTHTLEHKPWIKSFAPELSWKHNSFIHSDKTVYNYTSTIYGEQVKRSITYDQRGLPLTIHMNEIQIARSPYHNRIIKPHMRLNDSGLTNKDMEWGSLMQCMAACLTKLPLQCIMD